MITVQGSISGPDGPLADAFITFFPRDPKITTRHESASVDSMGTYSLRLETGTYEVTIHPPDRMLNHVERVTFTRSSTRYDHTFGGHDVTGSLRNPDGGVVDSGEVSVWLQYSSNRGATQTFHGGEYHFLLPTGVYSFIASPEDYWAGYPPAIADAVPVGSDTTIDLQSTGISVTGTVLDPDGVPREKVAVEAFRNGRIGTLTAADGRYRLWVLRGLTHFRFAPWDTDFVLPRIVGPIDIQANTTVDCDLGGVEWAGTVKWRATQAPASGVVVSAIVRDESSRSATSRTDAAGAFRLVLEPDKRYDLRAYSGIREIRINGLAAHNDTTFAFLVDPL
jgi:hypothetical protein